MGFLMDFLLGLPIRWYILFFSSGAVFSAVMWALGFGEYFASILIWGILASLFMALGTLAPPPDSEREPLVERDGREADPRGES